MAAVTPPAFDPVPVRPRRDGWTAERQRAFILWLAKGVRPTTAARLVGMSRKSAYALAARPDAAGFTAAWAEAVDAARRRRAALREPSDYERAVEGVRHPVRYRGRVVAFERRFDDRALVRLLGRVDRLIEKRRAGGRE